MTINQYLVSISMGHCNWWKINLIWWKLFLFFLIEPISCTGRLVYDHLESKCHTEAILGRIKWINRAEAYLLLNMLINKMRVLDTHQQFGMVLKDFYIDKCVHVQQYRSVEDYLTSLIVWLSSHNMLLGLFANAAAEVWQLWRKRPFFCGEKLAS